MSVSIIIGDAREKLRELPDASVHCCITSPPYFRLRDYDVEDQMGLEATPAEFVEAIVELFREVRRVLRDDGTLWLNLGDSYAGSGRGGNPTRDSSTLQGSNASQEASMVKRRGSQLPAGLHETQRQAGAVGRAWDPAPQGLKQKDLIGIPWMVAFALRADGWYLRQDIIWSKPNPMPESVQDRCTKAHEYVFLLAKSGSPTCWRHEDGRWKFDGAPTPDYVWRHRETREESVQPKTGEDWRRVNRWRGRDYFYDNDAIAEGRVQDEDSSTFRGGCYVQGDTDNSTMGKRKVPGNKRHKGTTAYENGDERHRTKAGLVAYAERERARARGVPPRHAQYPETSDQSGLDDVGRGGTRNKRSVWTVATQPFSEAHFATYPPALIEPCILAGCPAGGVVLDPFFGAGTTGLVADRLGRDCIGIELNPEYAEIARRRLEKDAGMFADVRAA